MAALSNPGSGSAILGLLSSHVIPRFDVLLLSTDQRNASPMIVMRPLRLCGDVEIQRMQVVLNDLPFSKRIRMMRRDHDLQYADKGSLSVTV